MIAGFEFNAYDIPLGQYLMKHAGVIPIAGQSEDIEVFNSAFAQISTCLKNGELVCLFPEGAVTQDGQVHSFKKGLEFILAKDPVPVIPMALQGLWGSIFSHKGARAFTKWPKRIWFPVYLKVANAIPAQKAQLAYLEEIVKKLVAD